MWQAEDITIGVPVYNGASLLDEALANLAGQSRRQFRVLIFDNASTDGTPEIARAWAARDDRFHHIRQSENVGGVQNFLDALAAAQTKYFMWRAFDDLSAPDFLEICHGLLEASPGAALAVSKVLRTNLDGSRPRITPVAPLTGGPRLWRIVITLFRLHESWFYGLWERETASRINNRVWGAYPWGWAADHLALFELVIEGRIVGSNETQFVQRRMKTADTEKPEKKVRADWRQMRELRRGFIRQCLGMVSNSTLSGIEKTALSALLPAYADRVVYPAWKIARNRARQALGSGAKPVR